MIRSSCLLFAGYFLGLPFTLMMEAVCASETSVDSYLAIEHFVLENGILQIHNF
jgi:hypothetical protein